MKKTEKRRVNTVVINAELTYYCSTFVWDDTHKSAIEEYIKAETGADDVHVKNYRDFDEKNCILDVEFTFVWDEDRCESLQQMPGWRYLEETIEADNVRVKIAKLFETEEKKR